MIYELDLTNYEVGDPIRKDNTTSLISKTIKFKNRGNLRSIEFFHPTRGRIPNFKKAWLVEMEIKGKQVFQESTTIKPGNAQYRFYGTW